MNFDNSIINFFKGINNGTLKVPNFMEEINPPSLFAYYNTLPQWCRDHPIVRNTLMAFEFTKPTLAIKEKEMALNYACSFLRPIDKELEDVLVDMATSHKIRLNMARIKDMVAEIKHYDFDPDVLGTDSDEEGVSKKGKVEDEVDIMDLVSVEKVYEGEDGNEHIEIVSGTKEKQNRLKQ